ncbi:hypothetical protein ANRL1_02949 [Anaerolineae bacterium]|nr:hypothetical protein ANRL1_02949 [Anaerolineae bacterium]
MSLSNRPIKFMCLSVVIVMLVGACGAPAATPAQPGANAPAEPKLEATTGAAPAAPAAPVVAPVSEPTLVPVPTEAPTAMPVSVGAATYNGLSFNYDVSLAQQITTTTMPAHNPGPDAPYWAITSAYDEFNFVGYPSKNSYHRPRIEVYSVEEFSAVNPAAKEQIDQLKQLLGDAPGAPERIPLIPIFNAAQVFRSQVKYLNFQSGQGVRFVTQYDQAIIPINNKEVFYTFQGLTSDGRYYITAILPVATSALPDTDQMSQEQMQTLGTGEAFAAYLNEVVQMLNGLPSASFTPNLDALDATINSLRVEK